jgi:YD repeat-containing protein
MKNKLPLLLFSALFFILSCGKNTPTEDPESCPPIILLSKISGTNNLDFTYVDKISLVKINDGEKSTEVFYTEGGFDYTFKFQYLDNTTPTAKGKVVDVRSMMNDYKPGEEIESNYEANQLMFQSKISYTYTEESVTRTQTRLDDNSVIIQKYTLKNNNIASFDNGSGTIYTYKYDDKRNPLVNRILKYRMGSIDFFLANSVVEVEENQNGIRKILKIPTPIIRTVIH